VTIFEQKGHFREIFELVMWGDVLPKKRKDILFRNLVGFFRKLDGQSSVGSTFCTASSNSDINQWLL
jgi:hypothetical protein